MLALASNLQAFYKQAKSTQKIIAIIGALLREAQVLSDNIGLAEIKDRTSHIDRGLECVDHPSLLEFNYHPTND